MVEQPLYVSVQPLHGRGPAPTLQPTGEPLATLRPNRRAPCGTSLLEDVRAVESNLQRMFMTESKIAPPLPDRLSVDPASPHHMAAVFEHDVGIRFNGKERFDVEEYCVTEGWIRVPAGRTLDRKGRPVMIKLKGAVEAFYR